MKKTTGKYIYCIIKKPKFFNIDFCGIDSASVYLVNFKDFAAVVSDSQMKDFPITRVNVITHQRVIEETMKKYSPVLPLSFGTVAENDVIIREKLLNAKKDELSKALNDIEGKVELNFKAIWLDMPKIFQKIVSENPRIQHIKETLPGKVLSRDQAITVGKLVADEIEARKKRVREETLSMFDNLIVNYKENPTFGEEMIFNLALLIPENKQETFDKIVRNFDERYKEENIYFKYIGPTPPFNFVNVPISLS